MVVRPGIDQEAEEQVKKSWWVPGSRYTWCWTEVTRLGEDTIEIVCRLQGGGKHKDK